MLNAPHSLVPKIFYPYIETWVKSTPLPQKILHIIFALGCSDFVYSNKKLSPSEKLEKQTQLAKKEGIAGKKRGVVDKTLSGFLIDPSVPFRLNYVPDSQKDIVVCFESTKNVAFAAACSQGGKKVNEDNCFTSQITLPKESLSLYCVCDGHGDSGKAGMWIKKWLPVKLQNLLSNAEIDDASITNALTAAFVDSSLEYNQTERHGTTALCMLSTKKKHYFANIGDSRVIKIDQRKEVCQLSEDADGHNPRFRKYYMPTIVHKGRVIVATDGICINLGRDFGSEYLCHRPKITCVDREKENGDVYLLATDGLWDVATIQEVGQCVSEMMTKNLTLTQMAVNLVKSAHETCKESVQCKNGETHAYDHADNILALMVKV